MLFRCLILCVALMGLAASHRFYEMSYTPGMGWHKLHLRAAYWNVARKICIAEGGHLAILNSYAEARVLMDLFSRIPMVHGAGDFSRAYIGIHSYYAPTEWVTVLGNSLTKAGYSEWDHGQPDNTGGSQRCGAFMKNGKLDDVHCTEPYAFICELPDPI